ncbi:phosducin-like protein 3 [Hydra vulgaris]|uniref:phosducin-like protein 3 n=1 Tax=Hydra vulgaris TaxID=6087 RepID=UPI00019249A0|nr:phosducin-like protein 3 [Hydra vulgaris]
MQDPNADTEWNDALRRHGIIPEKKEVEVTEDQIVQLLDATIKEKTGQKDAKDYTLEELGENEDDFDDDELLESIRRQRIAELMERQKKEKYGEIREISAVDYVDQVNNAGEGVWVVLHLYKSGIPLCELIDKHMVQLAKKFPATKFLRSISTTCIPNYPDKNLPTIFIYFEGDMKGQIAGPILFGGMNLTQDDLEWMLSKYGCVKSTLKSDPRGTKIDNKNGFTILSRSSRQKNSESEDDD